jgi:hypothetical protein
MKLKNTPTQEVTENEFFEILRNKLEEINCDNNWKSVRVRIVTDEGDSELITRGKFTRS